MAAGKLYQHGTLGGLMAGLFEGTLSIHELLKKGDQGIGTVDSLDGELIVLDGAAFQAKGDGTITALKGEEKVPYAAVASFEPAFQLTIKEKTAADAVKQQIQENMSSTNVFQTVKVTGTFSYVRVRAVEKQEKPYPRLVEAARTQPEFEAEKIKGTIIGFYTPELFQGVAAAGFHLHFLSDDQQFGGHLLDFTLDEGQVSLQMIETVEQHFPVSNATFMGNDIDYANLQEEIDEAEK
ncbi:acetolactate decarboxylase [Pisciglobus halotolerans]|uniref:Alpha-acetolactate decarboxylase n=1 Tax=Pisciglobus halotolerans TaxID=745365 RepID=A0A1I3BPI1_9LACT|nr:acetolactate decarboxylase [Pisciglobus halotolerans]SFH63829.1 acetolactate decarboxylase [Pisciglobus halotolerans]